MTRETCSGKSSNGKEKRLRSRRENVSVPGFFRPSPEKEIPSPEKRIPGLGISRSGPEISRQTLQKVKDTDKNLHRSPVLCKKIARKSSIWAGLRKSCVTKISQNGTICLFSQPFHDILFFLGQSEFDGDLYLARGRNALAGPKDSEIRTFSCDGFQITGGRKNPICCDGFVIYSLRQAN